MKRCLLITLAILLLVSGKTEAQDVHFTQFYSSPLYLNPAFTGAGVCSRISTTYRNQWPGVPNGYRSSLVSYDHHFHKQNLGAGLMIENDVAGTGGLRRTVINPLVAYEVRISRSTTIRAGFKPSFGMVSVNFEDLLFGDQIARGGPTGNIATIENPTVNVSYVDFGAGGLIYSRKAWFGFSANHFIQPFEGLSTSDDESFLPAYMNIHGGYKHELNPNARKAVDEASIFGSFNYRTQREFDQVDLGFYYAKSVFTIGFWYRGLPGVKAYKPGYGNSDAVAVILGLKTHRFHIGYSYDYTISKLTNASFGSHEISLSQQLCNPKKRRRKPKSWTPCPSF